MMSEPRIAAARRRTACLAVAVLAAAVAISSCSGSSGFATGDKGYIEGEGVIEQIPAGDRRKLPAFEGDTLDGGHIASSDYLGKILVINVWGSWCPPCRAEAPALRRVWEEYRNQGVQFVGINIRDNDAAARAFERKFKITYPSITTEESGEAMLAIGSFLPRGAIPSTLVVDREGRVAARVIGRTTYISLRELVTEALAEAD